MQARRHEELDRHCDCAQQGIGREEEHRHSQRPIPGRRVHHAAPLQKPSLRVKSPRHVDEERQTGQKPKDKAVPLGDVRH